MTDLRTTIVATTLAEHASISSYSMGGDNSPPLGWCCVSQSGVPCGWQVPSYGDLIDADPTWRAHQAAAVLAALDVDPRVAVVDGADLRVLLDETAGVARGYDEGYEAWCRLADANGRPE